MGERDVRAPDTNRRGRYTETAEYLRFVRRAIAALGRRVGSDGGDIEALDDLVELARDLDDTIVNAVSGLRAHGYSWADIGRSAGITRQTAHEKWAAKVRDEEGS